MEIRTHIKGGLPCMAVVTSYHPSWSGHAARWEDSLPDEDEELEFELRTLKGKPAPWMDKAATEKDLDRIECELLTALMDLRRCRDE